MFSTATSLSCDAVESQCRVYLQKWVCEHFGEHGQIHPNYAYPRKKLKTNHYIPHGQHLFVCFEASVDDIYREAPYGSFFKHPQLSKGTSVQGHMTPHGVFYNQQSDVRSQARVFVTSKVFLHFLYRTELLVSLGCWLVTETFTFTLRGATPTRSRRGDYLIMALFPPSYLPKCCRYEHDGKYLYSWVTCVVYNVWHTFTKNRDLFLIFKTRKWET